MKTLFILPALPRSSVSVRGVFQGTEALSGTHSSTLMVAERLAQRGHEIGMMIIDGQHLIDTALSCFTNLSSALEWVDGGRIILCSADNARVLSMLVRAGVRPWSWLQVPISKTIKHDIENGVIEGLIVVSDTCRLPVLHSTAHQCIGRIYNSLNPFFMNSEPCNARFSSKQAVFAGYLGETKGAHHLLKTWLSVRAIEPQATLVLAGSTRLYNSNRNTGSLGVAASSFEQQYVLPIIEKFGSLERAGITLAGLLTPQELRKLYSESAMGIVNLNWDSYTETFCCSAVEMLATGLPVLSVSAGALPETIGRSGGAALLSSSNDVLIARKIADLLNSPERLAEMGNNGRDWVLNNYHLDRIVDHWEQVLSADCKQLDKLSGTWQGKKGMRYWIERLAGRMGCGKLFDAVLWLIRLTKKVK